MIKFYDLKGNEIINLNFGRVRIGETSTLSIMAKNVGKFPLIDITFTVNSPDVEIIGMPRNLRIEEQQQISLKWISKVNNEFGLRCELSWSADELRGEE